VSKEKEERKKNIQDKRKEKLGRKEIHACEKCVKKNQMYTKEKGKKGILYKSFR
jgi:hypothetical protein